MIAVQSVPGKGGIGVGSAVDSLVDWKSFADMVLANKSSDLAGDGGMSVK